MLSDANNPSGAARCFKPASPHTGLRLVGKGLFLGIATGIVFGAFSYVATACTDPVMWHDLYWPGVIMDILTRCIPPFAFLGAGVALVIALGRFLVSRQQAEAAHTL